MDKLTCLTFVLCLMCYNANRVRSSCSSNSLYVEGFIGENISISCNISCYAILWKHVRAGYELYNVGSPCNNKFCLKDVGKTLYIFNLSFSDTSEYRCFCYDRSAAQDPWQIVTCFNMRIFCKAKTTINGKQSIYNNRNTFSPLENVIKANKNDEITVECHEGAELVTNCSRQSGITRSKKSLYQTSARYSCLISCILREEQKTSSNNNCTVDIFLQVHPWNISSHTVGGSCTDIETTSFHNPRPTDTSFSALVTLISVIVLFLVIAIALCLIIFLARYHNRHHNRCHKMPQEIVSFNSVNSPPGADISAYAPVSRKDEIGLKYCPTSMEFGTSLTSDCYSEVTRVKDGCTTGKQTSIKNETLINNGCHNRCHKMPQEIVSLNSINSLPGADSSAYATVGRKDEIGLNYCPTPMELGASITSDCYSEVTRTKDERTTGKQTSIENQTSITNHIYFEVKTESRRIVDKNVSTETGMSITNDFYSEVEIVQKVPHQDKKSIYGDPQTIDSYDRVENFQKEDHETCKRDACCTDCVTDYEVLNVDDPADNDINGLYASLNKTKK